MPRPPVCRRVLLSDAIVSFSPVPEDDGEPVLLSRDELESIRLCDVLGYYQDRAAEQMQVSRATLSRILERAHRKVGEALLQRRRLLVVDAGPIETYEQSCTCGCRRRRRMGTPGGQACPSHPDHKEIKS